jgi:hypothetical protein
MKKKKSDMKTTMAMPSKPTKQSETFIVRSLRGLSGKLEEFIVHKTQSERRRAFFGEDPMMRVN